MEVLNRKKFKGPGLALPPIHESVQILVEDTSSPSSQSTASSYHFQSRTPARRASIATCSSVKSELKLHMIKTQLRRDSLKQNELNDARDALTRRFDLLHKKTTKNTDVNIKPKRRQSMVTLMPPTGRRSSFRTIGSRVTNILKVKNAFKQGVKRRPNVVVEEEDIDKASEIKELPKEARFASTLSVEAQYAMMKGYEDVVFGYLSRSYPEFRPLLRRSRTPLAGVKVKVPEVIFESPTNVEYDSDNDDDAAETNDTESKSQMTTTSQSDNDSNDGNEHYSTSISSPMKHVKSQSKSRSGKTTNPNDSTEYSPRNNKGYNRIPTPPCYRSLPSSVASQRKHENIADIARYNSFPNLVSKDKQLVMTYRYQSVMDILDQIKKSIGLHATSPRLSNGCSGEPVRDFNLWSYVWNKEFEPTTC